MDSHESWINVNREFRQARDNRRNNFLNRWLSRFETKYPRWCIPWELISRIVAIAMINFALWTIAYAWIGDDMLPPEGAICSIYLLALSAYIVGSLVGKFTPIPPILVMLLIGMLYSNIGILKVDYTHLKILSILRSIALTGILIRAGLGLDAHALRLLGGLVLRLTFLPATVEIGVLACTSYFILDFPWLWGLLFGSVMATVSPAIVIPSLLILEEKGYGRLKGISTVIIAAAGLDDVYAISFFELLITIIFSTEEILVQVIRGLLSIGIGIAFGVSWGIACVIFPNNYDSYVTTIRILLILCGSLLAMFGSDVIGIGASGALAVMILSFLAYNGWQQLDLSNNNPIIDVFRIIWICLHPLLSSLIGSEVKFNLIDLEFLGWGIICMTIGVLLRSMTCLIASLGGKFNFKERLFIAIAWLPKATVQAALGPIAYDLVRNTTNDEGQLVYAKGILIMSAISILITAPLGALLMTLTGPCLLSKDESETNLPRDLQDTVYAPHL